jgi:hypothetical protein
MFQSAAYTGSQLLRLSVLGAALYSSVHRKRYSEPFSANIPKRSTACQAGLLQRSNHVPLQTSSLRRRLHPAAIFGRHMVDSTGMKRMAFANASHRQVRALDRSVRLQSLQRISRTGWIKPARRRFKRRNPSSIEAHWKLKRSSQHEEQQLRPCRMSSSRKSRTYGAPP